MEKPVICVGYNQQGVEVTRKQAVDATTQINPAEVKAAIENVVNVFEEQMQKLAQSLVRLCDDAEEAVIVQGTDMSGTIEDTAMVLSQLAAQMTNGIDVLYDYAVQAHDSLQRSNNNDAYNRSWSNGAVNVRTMSTY